ncbi:MAG: UvrD-helicase domain-containing protein [Planctomycetes bacterium]|nr:UvrD-helicase domain-containing protein [Planctomycetota bacterium]
MTGDPLLDDLTPPQREAVTHVNGPILVVAGAGSGKTRVVTRRVAHLVRLGVRPWRILALTFTNKAAREMRDRVASLVGEAPPWMGTFHSICARIIRNDIHNLADGRDNRFSILDSSDQESLVKQALKHLGCGDKLIRPSAILASISRAKSNFIPPKDYGIDSWRDEIVGKIYIEYEKTLRELNSLDFDDLLVLTVRLLAASPETLIKYRGRFSYLLVDEYQDTNRVQYQLLKSLAGSGANIHATGDPDQSIYSWRGADYRNIMDFQSDFPGARLVRLEENYRSGKFILAAANGLIRHNRDRIAKDLFTTRPGGEKAVVARLQSDRMEAQWIAECLAELREKGAKLGEMAVFYRTNAQSRPLEEALMRLSIPYQLVGGVRFYERREIKNLLAHLKLRMNPRDLASFRRVAAGRPGIGEKTLEQIVQAAEYAGQAVFSFLSGPDFPGALKLNGKLADFSRWCVALAGVDVSRADVAVKRILEHSGLIETAIASAGKDKLAEDRLENLHSLAARAGDFVQMRLACAPVSDAGAGEEEARSATAIDLAAFLEDVALVADVDDWASNSDQAALMTLHSAKGLEFDHVFVGGLEEGILPHRNSSDDQALEEERRLFYVGITRAKRRVWITHAACRAIHGNMDFSHPSRFLDELSEETLERLDYGDNLSLSFGGGNATLPGNRTRMRPDSAFAADFTDVEFPEVEEDFDPYPDFALEPDHLPVKRAGAVYGKKTPATVKPLPFRPGDLVCHPMFGHGKVLMLDKGKIMVQFFSAGTRLLQEELAQLSRE